MIDYAERFRVRERPTEGPGAKLYALRTARGLSVHKTALESKMSTQQYNNYELARTSAWSVRPWPQKSAVRVAELFDTTVEAIWGIDPRVSVPRHPSALSDTGNARLISERFSRGWTLVEAASRIGTAPERLVAFEGLTARCVNRWYRFTGTALRLAKLYERDPEWLFADVFVRVRVRPRYEDIEVSEDFFGLEDSPEDVLSRKQLCALAVSGLSARQRMIMEARAEGEGLLALGEQLGITRERVRQIESAALVKMRAALEAA